MVVPRAGTLWGERRLWVRRGQFAHRCSIAAGAAACLCLMLGCTITFSEPDEQSPAEKRRVLEKNRAIWQGSGVRDYAYRLGIECDVCNFWGEFVVDVRSDTTCTVVRDTARPGRYDKDSRPFVPSIAGLFDIAANALAMGAPRVKVSYDDSLGYPTRVFVDYSRRPDDEYTYRADSVVVAGTSKATKPGGVRRMASPVPAFRMLEINPIGSLMLLVETYRFGRSVWCSG